MMRAALWEQILETCFVSNKLCHPRGKKRFLSLLSPLLLFHHDSSPAWTRCLTAGSTSAATPPCRPARPHRLRSRPWRPPHVVCAPSLQLCLLGGPRSLKLHASALRTMRPAAAASSPPNPRKPPPSSRKSSCLCPCPQIQRLQTPPLFAAHLRACASFAAGCE